MFIGWYVASVTPSSSPTSIVNRIAETRTVRASRADGVNTSRSPPCRSWPGGAAASMTAVPVTLDAGAGPLAYPPAAEYSVGEDGQTSVFLRSASLSRPDAPMIGVCGRRDLIRAW